MGTYTWLTKNVILNDLGWPWVTYRNIQGAFHWATQPPTHDQPVTRSQCNASRRPIGDRPAAGKHPAARRRRFHGFLKIDGRGIFTLFVAGHRFLKTDGRFDSIRHWTNKLFNYQLFNYFKFITITQCMFDKNVYKMMVVCCNYAVASYLWSVTTVTDHRYDASARKPPASVPFEKIPAVSGWLMHS